MLVREVVYELSLDQLFALIGTYGWCANLDSRGADLDSENEGRGATLSTTSTAHELSVHRSFALIYPSSFDAPFDFAF